MFHSLVCLPTYTLLRRRIRVDKRAGTMRLNIVGLCCLLAAAEAFVLKQRISPSPVVRSTSTTTTSGNQKNPVTLFASTFSEIDGAKVKPPPSNRLAKAKLLLEEFSATDENEDLEEETTTTATATATSTATAATKSTKKTTSYADTKTNASTAAAAVPAVSKTIVPDSFWRNGHLQGGGSYVTRWAEGVKVAEPLVKYDPVAAEKLLFRQPTKWVVRNFQIALPIGWWAVGVAADFVSGQSSNRRARAEQLTNAISGLGPAIIKGGQALASRPDLLPSEYLEELQKLQDDVPRFSNQLALATVREELGKDFDEIFELVQEEPIAAASIGQVYKAILKENGDIVAIKIQRPGCEEIIALDLYVLRWWSGVYNNIFRLLNRDIDVQSIIDDFGELIYREIDYVAEAANAQRFNELYAGVKDVFVPKIYSELTTSKVLTMEWVDGFRLTDRESLQEYGLDESKLVDTLVQCSLRQILENGFFHADPHGGNLLACPDGRLCYLDFGMMSYADSKQRNGFLLAVVHIVNRDWAELAKLYVKLGFIPEGTDLRPIEVALEAALPDVLNADISELNFKNVVGKLGDIMYTFPFSLPPFYISIIRCLGVLEGLAIQVDPEARIIGEAYPYVASRVLTDSQDDLREALQRLALTNDGRVRWDRLEGLLDEAKDSTGYDVAAALDVLTDYMVSPDSDVLLADISEQIVNAADSLGSESIRYLFDATRAFSINDEVAAVRAFRALQEILQGQEDGFESVGKKVGEDFKGILPEPTTSMRRFSSIVSLLGGQNGQTDPAKFVPVVRKLAQDSRVQRMSNEILARLGERLLSRGLRAVFGLPPPMFGTASSSSTVTEDRK